MLQITQSETFKTNCEEKPLCVISILPHILDCQSDCRLDYLVTLNEMGTKYRKKLWGLVLKLYMHSTHFYIYFFYVISLDRWVWTEAGAQPNIENALDIGGFGYPAMAVVNYKKMKYSLLRGSFSITGINEFLRYVQHKA